MSTPQDNKMTTAGAENTSTSQDAGEKTASPPQDRTSAPSVSQTNSNPNDTVGNPSPGSPGHNLNPDPQPRVNGQLNITPIESLRRSIEEAFELLFEEMIDYFEKGNDKTAETIANEMVLWGTMPVLYRTCAHIVLAYGPTDGLDHAREAVQDAQWSLDNFGDKGVGEKLLVIAEMTLKDVMEDDEVDNTEEVTAENEESA